MGKIDKSMALLSEAEQLIPGDQRSWAAELEFVHADCRVLTDSAGALTHYTKAAQLAQGRDAFTEANALLGVGYVLLNDRHYDEAIDSLSRAFSLTDYPSIKQKALGNLGYCYAQLGDYKRAIDYSMQAATIAAETGNSDQKKWLLDLGLAYAALPGDYPGQAELQYRAALALATRLKDEDTAGKCLHNLAQLALADHDLDKAEQYWKQEVAIAQTTSSNTDSSFDEAEIAFARKDFARAEQLFKSIPTNPKTSAVRRSSAQEHLGAVYWAENKAPEADQMFRQGIRTAEKAMAEFRPEHRVSFLDQEQFFEGYIRFLVAQGKTAQALQLAEHARLLAKVAGVTDEAKVHFDITAIQSRLKKNKQTILDYQLTNDESFLWVITPSQFKVFTLPAHRELYTQIAAYNREIQDRNTENSAAGKKLYTTLIQPAEKLIPKGSRVTIIPSKILYGINFETLVVPGDVPHYWIEDVEVQVANSIARVESSGSRKPKPVKELLLIGAPVEVNKDFPVLRNAANEMRRLEKRFPGNGSKSISSQAATPNGYLSSHPEEYRFIHFVTHGTASETVPMESAIILSSDAGSAYKLYARDIVKVPLHADLVTISACYGAGTRWYQSEGIVGLSWAFLRAGAHQVVAGLWEVDDATTPELMDNFYAELQKGKTAAEALRTAKLKMVYSKTLYANPFYWASLQLYTGQ